MTVKPLRPVLTSIAMIIFSFVWISCEGPGGVPERKKMLDLTSGSSTGDCYFAAPDEATLFPTAETNMQVNGVNTQMVSVAVPHAAYDSIALANVQNVLPFAYPLLSRWAQQKKGVVINFSSSAGNNNYRVDYVLEAPGSFSIPVVLLYDQWSAYRAGAAVNLMHTLPVTCKPVMGYEGQDKRLRQSAFN